MWSRRRAQAFRKKEAKGKARRKRANLQAVRNLAAKKANPLGKGFPALLPARGSRKDRA